MNTRQSFSTSRLLVSPLNAGDSAFVQNLLNTDGWLQFIGNRNIHSIEDALAYINKINSTAGIHYWVVQLKITGEKIGLVTLIQRSYLPYHDIGFAFLPAFSGKGYATESAAGLMQIAFTSFKLPAVMAVTMPQNMQSVKLLEKLGMRFEKQLNETGETLLLYSKTAVDSN